MNIERAEDERTILYRIYDRATWEDGTPRPEFTVRVEKPHRSLGEDRPAEVSWPSTSDKRPELAVVVGRAITMAASEAVVMNEGTVD